MILIIFFCKISIRFKWVLKVYVNTVSEVWIKKRVTQRDKGTDGQDFSTSNQDSYQFRNFATNIIKMAFPCQFVIDYQP